MDDVVSFAISGSPPFKICSITIGAFQTAGGITLFCGAMGMRHAQAPRMMHTPEELEEGMGREDIAVVPLAIPMVTGLGAITTVIVLASEASTPPDLIVLFAALVATIATVWVKLHNARADRPLPGPLRAQHHHAILASPVARGEQRYGSSTDETVLGEVSVEVVSEGDRSADALARDLLSPNVTRKQGDLVVIESARDHRPRGRVDSTSREELAVPWGTGKEEDGALAPAKPSSLCKGSQPRSALRARDRRSPSRSRRPTSLTSIILQRTPL